MISRQKAVLKHFKLTQAAKNLKIIKQYVIEEDSDEE